jgi:aminoglycoside phosphotransferase (APT) family kinase protein
MTQKIPIFKSQWERKQAPFELSLQNAALLVQPIHQDSIESLTLLNQGCANTNYKVTFKTGSPPLIIRIYQREAHGLQVEQTVQKHLASQLPVPKILYADFDSQVIPFPYALVEYVDGILMREIILKGNSQTMPACVYEAGLYLDRLRQISFVAGGFFDNQGIQTFAANTSYAQIILEFLNKDTVSQYFSKSLHQKLQDLILDYGALLPPTSPANLVHADFDPTNILVKKINNQWQISAILDWEFSFAGSYLLDMGLMLRYSHHLPPAFQEAFISGIQAQGFKLPAHWPQSIKLMDLLCLFSLLDSQTTARPKMIQDILALITHTLSIFSKAG